MCLGFFAYDALGKAIGAVMGALGIGSLTAVAGYYFAPAAAATNVTGWIYGYFYGPIQTGVRLALAWWLWRQAVQERQVFSA